jgi:hypothetical protein
MSDEKENGCAGQQQPSSVSSTDIAETVICGLDGRVELTFIEPVAPIQGKTTIVDLTNPQPQPRWRMNRRSAGFVHVDLIKGIELWAYRPESNRSAFRRKQTI